jgi:hypothetical protein
MPRAENSTRENAVGAVRPAAASSCRLRAAAARNASAAAPSAYNACMVEQGPEDLQRRASAWRVASAYLADERAERLRAMTDDDAREIIARIFNGPVPKPIERECGLVAQQRLFRKLK